MAAPKPPVAPLHCRPPQALLEKKSHIILQLRRQQTEILRSLVAVAARPEVLQQDSHHINVPKRRQAQLLVAPHVHESPGANNSAKSPLHRNPRPRHREVVVLLRQRRPRRQGSTGHVRGHRVCRVPEHLVLVGVACLCVAEAAVQAAPGETANSESKKKGGKAYFSKDQESNWTLNYVGD